MSGPANTFAAGLNLLFSRWERQHGRPLSNSRLSRSLEHSGQYLSKAYLTQLRNGTRVNPSESTIRRLCEFFGVDSDYFAYDASRYTDDHDTWVITRLHRPELRRLGRAACGLSAANLERLIRAAEEIRRNDGLPPTARTAGI
ncbi:helix-turn-helix domain-containing protein [Nocardia inohanensis]|uniref:helix-turn-helix domain-containing protein n=1 Tax=Nocardia inohanensis TaxID=209246 RepID=UPI000832824F|nr:helix-turn-helix domain-containing protein [Nocardia inohanensis]